VNLDLYELIGPFSAGLTRHGPGIIADPDQDGTRFMAWVRLR
jgi:hypothetical protein